MKVAPKFIRRSEVLDRTGISAPTLYRLISENKFPTPVRLSDAERGTVRWVESEVDAWVAGHIKMRDAALQKTKTGQGWRERINMAEALLGLDLADAEVAV
jgi:prophage regulatory protein